MDELSPNADPARRSRAVVGVVLLLVTGVLIFARLGDKPLWDDEAITAMTSESVWATGDTGVRFGHNLVLYRNGLLTDGLHDRYTPPLQFYLAAPFLGLLGPTALAARLPFAIVGLATVLLLIRWMWKDRAGALMSVLIGLATAGNVSLLLFARTCRYYALATLLTSCVAYFYVHFDRTRRALWGLIVSSVLLLAGNYMSFAALWACVGIDFAFFGRKQTRPTWRDVATIATVHLIVLVAFLSVWNPLGRDKPRFGFGSWMVHRVLLVGWSLRDLDRCEFAVLILIALAPVVAWWKRRPDLARGAIAFATYVVIVSILSPQDLNGASEADVRYLTPVIPLGIALGAGVVHCVSAGRWLPAIAVGLIAFTTNVLNGTAFTSTGPRSTLALYARELARPIPDPYTRAIEWVRANVKFGQTVWVVPDFMAYPLMFHAPHALYAWQLNNPVKPALLSLPAFHYFGREAPDFILEFGPTGRKGRLKDPTIAPILSRYELADTLDTYYRDQYRPELMWRAFSPKSGFDRATDAIYVYRRRD